MSTHTGGLFGSDNKYGLSAQCSLLYLRFASLGKKGEACSCWGVKKSSQNQHNSMGIKKSTIASLLLSLKSNKQMYGVSNNTPDNWLSVLLLVSLLCIFCQGSSQGAQLTDDVPIQEVTGNITADYRYFCPILYRCSRQHGDNTLQHENIHRISFSDWLRSVKFRELNISVFWFLNFNLCKLSLRGPYEYNNKRNLSSTS